MPGQFFGSTSTSAMNRKKIFAIAAVLLACVPVAAFSTVKPLRILAPAFFAQLSCVDGNICTDDPARLAEARRLYQNSQQLVASRIGGFRHDAKALFCSSPQCAETFGLGRRAGLAFGYFGIAIAPRGWTDFYVRHELIHHRQAEELGNWAVLRKPEWLIEGMAYSLSEDPRRPLPALSEAWRADFEAWYASMNPADLWLKAKAQP